MSNHHRLAVLGLRTLAGTPLNHSITSLFTYKSEDYIIKSHYIIHKRFEQLAIAFLRGFLFSASSGGLCCSRGQFIAHGISGDFIEQKTVGKLKLNTLPH